MMPKAKPAYREIERWSRSNHGRGGARVTNFFLHTQEGDGTAESLAGYLQNTANQVSYHYTVDNGGTVCDVVDTDYCSWSVLDANPISINLCFAGSRASWSRQQWLDRMGRAIEIAAYLAVQDCRKYGIQPVVIAPPYRRAAGISDHRYVTRVLGMGTHTDVGDGFPWDVFTQHVVAFTTDTPTRGDDMTEEDRRMLREVWEQLRGPDGKGWAQLGVNAKGEKLSLVDGVAKLLGGL
jgi:N-acetyl-anhydromuramyl-L-alanine amidase AmpD